MSENQELNDKWREEGGVAVQPRSLSVKVTVVYNFVKRGLGQLRVIGSVLNSRG